MADALVKRLRDHAEFYDHRYVSLDVIPALDAMTKRETESIAALLREAAAFIDSTDIAPTERDRVLEEAALVADVEELAGAMPLEAHLVPTDDLVHAAVRATAKSVAATIRALKRPAAPDDGWIKHDGGPCPVEPQTIVEVRERDGSVTQPRWTASDFEWDHNGSGSDILFYRPAAPAPSGKE